MVGRRHYRTQPADCWALQPANKKAQRRACQAEFLPAGGGSDASVEAHLPLVPSRIYPDGNLRLPFKELAEKLGNLGVGGELLEGFRTLPFIDSQVVPPILRIEENFVRQV